MTLCFLHTWVTCRCRNRGVRFQSSRRADNKEREASRPLLGGCWSRPSTGVEDRAGPDRRQRQMRLCDSSVPGSLLAGPRMALPVTPVLHSVALVRNPSYLRARCSLSSNVVTFLGLLSE